MKVFQLNSVILILLPGTENQIYEKLNLKIPINQNLVIMGSIGSGKSTFAKITCWITRI